MVGPTDELVGLEAAKLNLRLAVELSRGDLPLSRAYWVLGAQYARETHEDGGVLLATGYALITSKIFEPANETTSGEWEELTKRLGALERPYANRAVGDGKNSPPAELGARHHGRRERCLRAVFASIWHTKSI